MKNKIIGILAIFLLVFSVGVSAYGSNLVKASKTYKSDSDVFFNGVNYNKEDVSSRYQLTAFDINGRVSLKGDLVVTGKGFNIRLKNIKSIGSLTQNPVKKGITKQGKTYFTQEEASMNIEFDNKVSRNEKSFDIYAKTDIVLYNKDSGRHKGNQILRFIYEDGKLNVYDMEGEFKVLTL